MRIICAQHLLLLCRAERLTLSGTKRPLVGGRVEGRLSETVCHRQAENASRKLARMIESLLDWVHARLPHEYASFLNDVVLPTSR